MPRTLICPRFSTGVAMNAIGSCVAVRFRTRIDIALRHPRHRASRHRAAANEAVAVLGRVPEDRLLGQRVDEVTDPELPHVHGERQVVGRLQHRTQREGLRLLGIEVRSLAASADRATGALQHLLPAHDTGRSARHRRSARAQGWIIVIVGREAQRVGLINLVQGRRTEALVEGAAQAPAWSIGW